MNPSSSLLVLLLCVVSTYAATKTAVGSNVKWSVASSWSPSGVPQTGDSVILPDKTVILFDTVTPRLNVVDIREGSILRFFNGLGINDTEIVLQANTILVTGKLEIGTEDTLFSRRARIVLLNDKMPIARDADLAKTATALVTGPDYGLKMLAVYGKGNLEIHGEGRQVTWTKISAPILKGDTNFTVSKSVDWKVGDRIIVCTTDYDYKQTEEKTIIARKGKKITVDSPFAYGHFGEVLTEGYDGYQIDMRAEVGVLTSNIVVEGDRVGSVNYTEAYYDPKWIGYGGHSIFIQNSTVRIEGAEFRYMGQGGRMGRYPVHWHMRGDAPGQYIKRSSVHDTYHRTITVHATNYVAVENVVAYKCFGHSVYLEDSTEIGNVFWENLIVTSIAVGSEDKQNELGYLHDAACSNHAPGIRAQFLDYTPSGLWITNVNNTFVGNSMVGHSYGIWIRVDMVFSEPGFPCVTCTCPIKRVDMEALYGYGMVMVDNVVHSNAFSGIWIKENWVPNIYKNGYSFGGDVHSTISGLLAYKNFVGFEVYGVGTVHFDMAVGADNHQGIMYDWQRRSSSNWTRTLLTGETENFGNPDQAPYKAPCSAAFGSTPRSKAVSKYIPSIGYRNTDQRSHLNDVTVMNYLTSGCYEDSEGGWRPNFKIGRVLPPDTVYTGVKFNKTTLISSGSGIAGPGSLYYQGGIHDIDGSFPCVTPGSYVFQNTPGVVTKNCEFRSNWNMFVCPPLPNGAQYRQIGFIPKSQYQYYSQQNNLNITWECNNGLSIPPVGEGYRMMNVRTDKLYHAQFNGWESPGVFMKPFTDNANNVPLEPTDVVFIYPGKWTFTYWDVSGQYDEQFKQKTTDFESQCACNVTYVKVRVSGFRGQELRATYNSGLKCNTTCGNPWPIPAPTGYSCSDTRVVTSNKNVDTCPGKPLRTEPRGWVDRPSKPVYELNGTMHYQLAANPNNNIDGEDLSGAVTMSISALLGLLLVLLL